MLPPVEKIAMFYAICAHLDASVSGLARERSQRDGQLVSCCPFVPGSRACLHTALCMAPRTSPKFNSPQKTLRVWLLVCSVSFTSLHLINCYCASKVRCLCSLLTVCISPTWQSTSGPPVSLSFHLLFPFHNVKLLRLQILTGNVSLQTERVSITCLMFH